MLVSLRTEVSTTIPHMHHESILYKYFGYKSFRGIQKDIVESIASGKDTLGLMPTGGGKSITFQVPALEMEGVCIVVTPLISLMKDQVTHLRERGILASAIHSGMDYATILQMLDNAVYGGLKFLYVSPERLASPLFLAKLTYMKVCFIAVDEAHCISQWGYDFRPSYLHVADIRRLLPDIPLLALTATATPLVVEDIMRLLDFDGRRVYRMSFRRENLAYVVRKTEDKQAELLHILKSVKGPAVVYVRSRQGTKDVCKMLKARNISATYYHAGLDFAVKDQHQNDWQSGEVRVIVATNAFGMGIDKPDVRLVVHMDCPDSLEAYFQEAGRAGRDGGKSYAVLLYNRHDRAALLSRTKSAFPEKKYIRKVYDDLAYFFQLALYDGEGAHFEFNIERFCQVFHHFPTHLHGALTILQRAGYIEYDSDPDTHPRCMFLIQRDGLYNLHGMSPLEEDVVTALLRIYCGLFADLVYIEEKVIADNINVSVEQVRVALKSLSQRRIIKYVPRRNVPVIYYPCQRIESERLRFERNVYEDLQERMAGRLNAVIEYAESETECRSSILLRYFGETSSCDCGKCDVCIAMRRERRDVQAAGEGRLSSARDIIVARLKESGGVLPISSIRDIPLSRAELLSAIESLREDSVLLVEGSNVRLTL